jgi:DNA phosphorothioation-associated putative methyltransferase
MASPSIPRHRTALSRSDLSRPLRLAIEDELVQPSASLFDYGCGRGADVKLLRSDGFVCDGWDPKYFPDTPHRQADVVNLGYVINVIEDPHERSAALRSAWQLAQRALVVAGRLTIESRNDAQVPYADGLLTKRNTFQKFFEQHELRRWIDETLGVSSVPAAPGIFYVFREEDARQSFLASRYRRLTAAPRLRRSDILFETHRELLDPLIEFIARRGRLPHESELEVSSRIVKAVGSLRTAFAIIRRATGDDDWQRVRDECSQDLLVYLALARFDGRPPFSRLAHDLRLDVRAFFGTYRKACAAADTFLFSAGDMHLIDEACRSSGVGKLTPSALYLHTSALPLLPAVLRVYEGCARSYLGAVDAANVVKLHRSEPRISYLAYPSFETDPHPALLASLSLSLRDFRVKYLTYTDSENPPILHRKETFVAPGHPLRAKFERLTQQEERWGLFEDIRNIGTRLGWESELKKRGVEFSGSRLVRSVTSATRGAEMRTRSGRRSDS